MCQRVKSIIIGQGLPDELTTQKPLFVKFVHIHPLFFAPACNFRFCQLVSHRFFIGYWILNEAAFLCSLFLFYPVTPYVFYTSFVSSTQTSSLIYEAAHVKGAYKNGQFCSCFTAPAPLLLQQKLIDQHINPSSSKETTVQ